MRLYIKGDYTKKIPFGYMKLAGKMWFEEEEQNSFSNVGDNEALQNDYSVSLRLNKFDRKWLDIKLETPLLSHKYETLDLEFEDAYATNYNTNGECLRIASSHLELLTVDLRAMYIMALEVTRAIDGQISEDDKKTWKTPVDFESLYKDVLSLTYEEATDKSLEEIKTLEAIKEPTWAEDEERKEAYQRWVDKNSFGF
jgi:hypothetical protein